MPWELDENQMKYYRPSVYSKLELPTWNEVYNDFYKGGYWNLKEDDPRRQELDIYWKIPRYKYLWATCSNQFNKMIHEDKMFPDLLNMLVVPDYRMWSNKFPIYHIPHPKGTVDPFIIPNDKVERIDVSTDKFTEINFVFKDELVISEADGEVFNEILNMLVEPFREYFEGECVGWKDANGNPIVDSSPKQIGYDSAK